MVHMRMVKRELASQAGQSLYGCQLYQRRLRMTSEQPPSCSVTWYISSSMRKLAADLTQGCCHMETRSPSATQGHGHHDSFDNRQAHLVNGNMSWQEAISHC